MKSKEQIERYIESVRKDPELLNSCFEGKSPAEIFINALEFVLKPEIEFHNPYEDQMNSCIEIWKDYEEAIRYLYAHAFEGSSIRKQCLQRFMNTAKILNQKASAAWHVYRQCASTLPFDDMRTYSTDGNYNVL